MPTDAIAAIDLGSNSFHMVVARMVNGHLQILDRLREMVQLGAGLDSKNRLSVAAQERALECLARFGQRLRHIPPEQLRIVGTNTLRQARNSAHFLSRAEAVLGHTVEIISGYEEARLIHLGVVHSVADVAGRRLVIDIGGGSTELIIGEKFDPLHLTSLKMGCVSLSRACFDDVRMTESRLREAEMQVRLRLEPVALEFREWGWQVVTGASGTIKAIASVIAHEGWCKEGIDRAALQRVRAALLETTDATAIAERWSLEPARARVFAGGFVVLYVLCEMLDLDQVTVADGALREGVIYDLLGRIRHEDVRDNTICALADRYHVDKAQAERVRVTTLALWQSVKHAWGLAVGEADRLLEWAARLHEVGMSLSYRSYHKHGAYILEHGDLPGFSRSDQLILATLVRRHRRSFRAEAFAELPQDVALLTQRLCVLLRLAVVLHRSRDRQPLPPFTLRAFQQQLEMNFPAGWLPDHPLTHADLTQEAADIRKAGFRLNVS